MNFKELLLGSKDGDNHCTEELFRLYKPLLVKEAIVAGAFDEDLYQELCITMLHCIRTIKV